MQGCALTGNGEVGYVQDFDFVVVNNSGGTVSPGDEAGGGSLAITGGYSQGAGGLLELDILGAPESESGFDRITASHTVELRGMIDVRLADGFMPGIGTVYTVVEGQSRAGEFDLITGLEIAQDRRFNIVYTDTAVQLEVVATQ